MRVYDGSNNFIISKIAKKMASKWPLTLRMQQMQAVTSVKSMVKSVKSLKSMKSVTILEICGIRRQRYIGHLTLPRRLNPFAGSDDKHNIISI